VCDETELHTAFGYLTFSHTCGAAFSAFYVLAASCKDKRTVWPEKQRENTICTHAGSGHLEEKIFPKSVLARGLHLDPTR